MPWEQGQEKPPKVNRLPFDEQRVKCLWCDRTLKYGRNYKEHCKTAGHEYYSYRILGQATLSSMFSRQPNIIHIRDEHQSSESEVMKEESEAQQCSEPNTLDEENDEQQSFELHLPPEENKAQQNSEREVEPIQHSQPDSTRGMKRERQLTLFESFGKLAQFELVVRELIQKIENPEQEEYLTQIQSTLHEMKKLEAECGMVVISSI